MKPIRSLLFVPGHKPSWVEKAWNAGPDGLILDLEDSVPNDEKEKARKIVRKILNEAPVEKYYCVRVNGSASGLTFDDIEGIAHPKLDAVMVPKAYSARDMERADEYLTVAERRNGVAGGRIALPLLVETAQAMRFTYEFATASPRTDAVMMSAGPGGDAQRAVGYKWSKEATETLYIRSRAVLDARAASLPPYINSWYDIKDIDGLAADARLNRSLGYAGMAVIHPSHVPVVNDVFTPTAEEIAYYKGLLDAFREAEKQGHAAVVYEGDMVDYAMAKTAEEVLESAEKWGVTIRQ